MSFIENLQNKSPKEKRKILWIFVGISTFAIFTLWLTVFPKEYLKPQEGQKSLGDIKEEFNNTENSEEYNQYMESLKALDNFTNNSDLEALLNGEQTESSNEIDRIESDTNPDNHVNLRLPLEE